MQNDRVIQGIVRRVYRDCASGGRNIQGTEIPDVPIVSGVEREGVEDSPGIVTPVLVQALLILQVAIAAFAVHDVDAAHVASVSPGKGDTSFHVECLRV